MKKKAVRGTGRIAFLARLEEIKNKVEAGYPLLTIYQEHQANLSFSYSQFVKYVHKYIRGNTKEKKNAVVAPATNQPKIKDKELSTVEIFDLPMDKKEIF